MDYLEEPGAEKARCYGVQETETLQLIFMHPLSQNKFLKIRAATNFSCRLKHPVMAKLMLLLNRDPSQPQKGLCMSRKRVSSCVQCKRQSIDSFLALLLRKTSTKISPACILPYAHPCSTPQHGRRGRGWGKRCTAPRTFPGKSLASAKPTWFQVSLQTPKHKYIPNSAGEAEPTFWQGCVWD